MKIENLELYSVKLPEEKDSKIDESILIMANKNILVSIPSFEKVNAEKSLAIKASDKFNVEIDQNTKDANFKISKITIAGNNGELIEYYLTPVDPNLKQLGAISCAANENTLKDFAIGDTLKVSFTLC